MIEPLPLQATATYLKSLAVLKDLVNDEFLKAVRGVSSDAEMRGLRRRIQDQTIARLKEEKRPYTILHYGDLEQACPVKGCDQKVKGGYYEVSNPVTNKNVMIPSAIAHGLLEHLQPGIDEACFNLGNSPMGNIEQYANISGLIKTLENSDVPEEVLEELRAVVDQVEKRQAEVLNLRPKVANEDLNFEPTDADRALGVPAFYQVLKLLVKWGAEDIHIKAGFPPMGVVKGDVQPSPDFPQPLTEEISKHYAYSLMTAEQQRQFEEIREMDLSFLVPGVARFRCNTYWAQGQVGMVLRVIPTEIRPAEVLGIPPVLKKLVFERMGLVLVTGQTGSGKTTTLAALIEYANWTRRIHCLTLENPVEYVYEGKRSIFTQRAVEIDSLSFPMGMRAALREKPDIILIGEMRDPETITAGLKAAETGHLVLSTLHTNDAVQTINRLVNAFPPHEQETVRLQLANTIRACIAQRLVPRLDKPGRVAAIEVLLVTPNARGQNTRDYIARNEINELYKVIATSGYDGMQSMNMALYEYYRNGVISGDDALAYSDYPDELIRWMREGSGVGASIK